MCPGLEPCGFAIVYCHMFLHDYVFLQNAVKKTKFLEEDLTPREPPRYKKPGETVS